MSHCKFNSLITDLQYGGRKGRQAQNAVLKQVLIWDIAKLQNKLLASHMADARANFDRNMSHIVGRALINRGFDPKVVHFYQKFLRQQIFHIRTSFGICDKSYSYDPNNPLFGDGQGIGWSSVNQIIISSVIDEIYIKLASKFNITSANGVFKIITGVNFFIDDRFSNTINHNNNIHQLLKDLQHNETLQTNLLNDTGGAVAPKKCAWWLLERKPTELGFNFRIKPSVDGRLFLQNTGDPQPYKIKQLPPKVAKEYLGCLISPTFSPKAQLSKLHSHVDKWCSNIRHANISSRLIHKSYREQLVPKLAYPLIVCDLTRQQADALMRKIRLVISIKTKYRRTTPLVLTHDTDDLLGEELPHIYDLAGREKVAFFFYHVRNSANKQDTVYDTLMTSFLDHQLALGYHDNFLNLDYKVWGKSIKTRTWMISMWDYLSSHDTCVDIINSPKYLLPRENNFYLMQLILEKEKDLENIQIFNKVRTHLELITASDITLDDRETIHRDIIHEEQLLTVQSRFKWPTKQKIPSVWFDIFRQMIHTHVAPTLRKENLGDWLEDSHQLHLARQINKNTIYFRGYKFNRYLGNIFQRGTEMLIAPANASRVITATTTNNRETIRLLSTKRKATHETDLPHPDEWRDSIWGLQIPTEDEYQEIAENMRRPFIFISDGGCPPFLQCSIFSWVLADLNGKIFYKNGGAIGGFFRDHTSFRAEAYAALSGLSFINYMEQHFENISTSRQFYSDNKELSKLQPSLTINPKHGAATKRNYDVKTQLQHEMASLSVPTSFQHVLGHQDDYKNWTDLDMILDNPNYMPPPVSHFLPTQRISLRTPLHRLVSSSPNEICIDSRTAQL